MSETRCKCEGGCWVIKDVNVCVWVWLACVSFQSQGTRGLRDGRINVYVCRKKNGKSSLINHHRWTQKCLTEFEQWQEETRTNGSMAYIYKRKIFYARRISNFPIITAHHRTVALIFKSYFKLRTLFIGWL